MFWTALSIFEVVYVLALSVWILLEKRSPVATLAWILALGALPGLGFVLFYFLGPRRLRRPKRHKLRARKRVRAQLSEVRRTLSGEAISLEADQLMTLMCKTGETAPSTAEQIDILVDPDRCYELIAQAVDAAEKYVYVEYYIFAPGRAATRLLDALTRAAQRGVVVRILGDAIGSSALGKRHLQALRQASGQFEYFNPVLFARLRAPLNFRNHRKIVVCDGRVAFTGGINVTDEYLPDYRPTPWRDTHMRMVGEAAHWLALLFLEDWAFATGQDARVEVASAEAGLARDKLRENQESPVRQGHHIVQVLPSGPDHDFEAVRDTYFSAIAGARQRILLTTPYFVPDEAILVALTTAALRGVDVRVLVPKRSDSRVVTLAARSYYDALLQAGARVFEYGPAMLHAKTMVIDESLAFIGTANMDNRSFRLNFEVSVALFSHEICRNLAQVFDEDLHNAQEVTRAKRLRLHWAARIGEAGSRLLSPML
jgi:cardiolipin synthase